MSNKGLLVIIAVILLGIFATVLINTVQQSPSEQVADSFSELAGKVGDKIENSASN